MLDGELPSEQVALERVQPVLLFSTTLYVPGAKLPLSDDCPSEREKLEVLQLGSNSNVSVLPLGLVSFWTMILPFNSLVNLQVTFSPAARLIFA